MRFIAIDFETANSKRNSPCEIGLVKVEDFQIVEEKSFLIKPKENYFNPFNISIHGIDGSMVKEEPEFDVIYEKIRADFESFPLIAHNAAFDMSVLRQTLDLYNIPYPETEYSCTYQMAKVVLNNQLSLKLNAICNYFNIPLEHHRALPDSIACAEVAMRFFKEKEVRNFSEIGDKFNLRVGKLFNGGYHGSVTKRSRRPYEKVSDLEFDSSSFQPENPFYEQTVVFTGTLNSMTRKEAQIMVLEIGGQCKLGVTLDTDFLIVGEQDFRRYGEGHKSSKMKKAEKYLSGGHSIELLSEGQFLEMIGNE